MTSVQPSALNPLFQEELYFFTSPFVVCLPKPWGSYATPERTLLQKILTSVKVDLDTVQMVVQPSIELESLKKFSPSRVLIFGGAGGADIPLYESTPAHDFIVIRADDLSEFDEQKKKNLWVALRQMFGV